MLANLLLFLSVMTLYSLLAHPWREICSDISASHDSTK